MKECTAPVLERSHQTIETFWFEPGQVGLREKMSHAVSECLQRVLFIADKYAMVRAPWHPWRIPPIRPAMRPVCIVDSFSKRRRQNGDTLPAIMFVKNVGSALIDHQKCSTHRESRNHRRDRPLKGALLPHEQTINNGGFR